MSKDLSSQEIKDPFARAMKRFVEPADVWTPRRLWFLRILAGAGVIYSLFFVHRAAEPAQIALYFGSVIVVVICEELRRLWARVERLESDLMLRDLASRPIEAPDVAPSG
jgi:hypothetical protein